MIIFYITRLIVFGFIGGSTGLGMAAGWKWGPRLHTNRPVLMALGIAPLLIVLTWRLPSALEAIWGVDRVWDLPRWLTETVAYIGIGAWCLMFFTIGFATAYVLRRRFLLIGLGLLAAVVTLSASVPYLIIWSCVSGNTCV